MLVLELPKTKVSSSRSERRLAVEMSSQIVRATAYHLVTAVTTATTSYHITVALHLVAPGCIKVKQFKPANMRGQAINPIAKCWETASCGIGVSTHQTIGLAEMMGSTHSKTQILAI